MAAWMNAVEFASNNVALVLVTLLVVLLFIVLCRQWFQGSGGMPPGPPAWPLIGNMHLFLRGEFHEVLCDLGKRYGDVLTVSMGPSKMVVLNSHEVNKDALAMDGFSGRTDFTHIYQHIYPTNAGIVDAEGSIWKSNRKLCLRHLSQLGFGKKSFEPVILEEVDYLLENIRSKHGEQFVIDVPLAYAVSNLVCRLIFGKRYDYGDEEFLSLLKSTNDFVTVPMVVYMAPFLKPLPFVRHYFDTMRRALQSFNSVVSRHLEEHRTTMDNGENLDDDLVYAYMNETQNDNESKLDRTVFEDIHVQKTMLDLFGAGTETTVTTLRWAIAYLINFPDVQEKLRGEIVNVIGVNRQPSYKDLSEMPFTRAFIAEVQRHATLIPVMPHKTTDTVQFRGYTIPPNTSVLVNIFGTNMDKKHFPNPQVFRPERFIDARGQFDTALLEKTIPFGVGKRYCLGAPLARMELFLFLTSLVQRFKFQCPDGASKPSLVGRMGSTLSPESFSMCAVAYEE